MNGRADAALTSNRNFFERAWSIEPGEYGAIIGDDVVDVSPAGSGGTSGICTKEVGVEGVNTGMAIDRRSCIDRFLWSVGCWLG